MGLRGIASTHGLKAVVSMVLGAQMEAIYIMYGRRGHL